MENKEPTSKAEARRLAEWDRFRSKHIPLTDAELNRRDIGPEEGRPEDE